MAGVVRRDGLREAVTALRDEIDNGRYLDLAEMAAELTRVLDAVPDVPPDPPAVDREAACACGDMDLCPTCRHCMDCEVGRQDCGGEMHCAGGCWTNCRTCVADAGSGTR